MNEVCTVTTTMFQTFLNAAPYILATAFALEAFIVWGGVAIYKRKWSK